MGHFRFAHPSASCYRLSVVRQVAFATILIAALFSSAVRLPATICPVASAPMGKACEMGCCATKCCCTDSQKNHNLPSVPAAKDSSSNHQLLALAAPSLTNGVMPIRSVELMPTVTPIQITGATPRPALLCTFLI
jgi:hypothetical protein